ncbi:MAG: T9SS type A sorting domain-containing protein [Saprospiraceae bacterium]|nr:T9SS type A sorting domain-containing protein [Saprospiraceae bacterium]
MKKIFRPFCNANCLAFLLISVVPVSIKAQILFTQDFNASTTISTYIGTGPNQFDFIGVNGTGSSSVYASSNRLNLQRNGNNVGFARTIDLATPAPDVLKIKFKISVPFGTAMASGTAGVFYVGSDLVAAANTTGEISTPTNGSRHSTLGITIAGANMFYLRELVGFTNSGTYTGIQDVTWFINNSGATINYTDPAGGSSSLADDVSDVWVGTTRVFAAIPAITPSQTIPDFKFLFNNANGNSAIALDDIEISTGFGTPIPVTLSSFTAQNTGATNQLIWKTESELNNKGYDIQRQSPNGNWESLGFVKGLNKASRYTFEDKTPLSISYYRLRQMDFDGKETLSKVVSVSQNQKGQVHISPNPASDKINIVLPNNDPSVSTTITVYDLVGKQVLAQKTMALVYDLDISGLAKGTYLIKINSSNSIYTEKIIRQ